MASIVDETTINRMARLVGDLDKAECNIRDLRSITQKLDQGAIEAEAEIFKSMGDPCRVKILMLLKEGELCVCEIMIALDRPQSTTSHHLSILRDAGLVRERKDGTWSKYRLFEGAVIDMLKLGKIIMDQKEAVKDDKN